MSMGRRRVSIPSMDPVMVRESCQSFSKYDADSSGEMDKKEFRLFLSESWKAPVSKYLFEIIDTDHSGIVSLTEFLAWAESTWAIAQRGDKSRWLRVVFDSCDGGSKGYLNKKEFLKFLKYNDADPGLFSGNATFRKSDADGSGGVDFEECLKYFETD